MLRIETATSKLDKPRRDLLRTRLMATNTAASPVLRELRGTAREREVPLHIWVFSGADEKSAEQAEQPDDELVAGLDGHVWARWLHIDLLWVDARHRGTGLGTRLVDGAERIAREDHACHGSRVSTWDFQAPGFYRKCGYDVVCEIPDYPQGITEYTLTKQLG